METATYQADPHGAANWTWPFDDRRSVDISPYYVSRYPKAGLSAWIGAARLIGDTAEEWRRRRQAPIVYLLKVADDAIHERLYYVLARARPSAAACLLGSHSTSRGPRCCCYLV